MKAVIGLFEHQADAVAVASFARNSGIADNRVKVLDSASAPADLVEPGPRSMTMRGIRGFTILGLAIFAIFGLSAAITTLLIGPTLEMSSAETQTAAVIITVVFILIGIFSGLFMGWVKGRSDADNNIQEFREAIEHGATAVVVQTDTRTKDFAEVMTKHHAHAVYVTKQVKPMAVVHPEALAMAGAH